MERGWVVATVALAVGVAVASAEVRVATEVIADDEASSSFAFSRLPRPAVNDAATTGKWSVVEGELDANSGSLAKLHDGQLPRSSDDPVANSFFRAGTRGGRLLLDLGRPVAVQQVNTFSWHTGTRGPQVYTVFASDGASEGFQPELPAGVDPVTRGWKRVASVDTRPASGDGGGQHAASITEDAGTLGTFRYLLFEVSRTEDRDAFGNTFYSEVDVLERGVEVVSVTNNTPKPIRQNFATADGKYRFVIDTTAAPDLTEWADKELRPLVIEWYPKLVAMLPSEGFQARTNVTLRFRTDMGGTPASAGGGFINCNAGWFRRELKREALGSIVHEMVHVVQSYGRVPRGDTNYSRMPGWLVEGIPDYIRWFIYEPQTRGAEITARNFARARYDASYRVSGNFLDWASRTYNTNLVMKLNAAGRAGKYREDLWKELTGKNVQALGDEWKRFHAERLKVPLDAAATTNAPVQR
jgi:hypothetical protein